MAQKVLPNSGRLVASKIKALVDIQASFGARLALALALALALPLALALAGIAPGRLEDYWSSRQLHNLMTEGSDPAKAQRNL